MKYVTSILLLFANLLLPPLVGAQSTALVAGVADARTGKPLLGAEVVLVDLHRIAHTDWLGEARIADVPSGKHRVRVRKPGYTAADVELPFQGDTIGPVFMLEAAPSSLDTVRVTADRVPARLEPFEIRRRMGIGRFLTDAELVKEGDRPFAFVAMTHFPGLEVMSDADGKLHIVSMSGFASTTAFCPVKVYLDDMDLTEHDFDLVHTWDLAGIEYYSAGEVPVQYRVSGSACGVLLLWSKR